MLPVCRRPSVTAREALDDRLRRRFGERDDRSGRVNEGVVVREENAERATPTAEQCGAIYREQVARELASGARVGHQQVRLVVRELFRLDLGSFGEKPA